MNKLILAVAVVLAVVLSVSSDPIQPKCAANEIFATCGTACPEHCPTRNVKTGQLEDGLNVPCIKMCKVGCACAHGFVRDLKRSNICVERSLCSAP